MDGAEARDPRRVFVVYGRNRAVRASLFQLLRALGLHPLEWNQAVELTASAAPFVGDVLSAAFGSAQAVVVLMTPDDLAQLRPELIKDDDPEYERALTGQARPNVLFEAGMALGLHPDRTLIIEYGRLRPFSDIGGRHVLRFDGSTGSRQTLAVRLESAGCAVSRNGTDWLEVGTFDNPETPGSGAEPTTTSPVVNDTDPKLAVRATRLGEHRFRLALTNRGPGTLKDVNVTLPDDLALLLFDDDLPLNELLEGDTATFPLALLGELPRLKAVPVDVNGRLESGRNFTTVLQCEVK
jgi:predicted nucleotide-binding protein